MKAFLRAQFSTFFFSWFVLLTFVFLGGSINSSYYKLFMFVFLLIPGLLAYYYAKREKIKLPLFRKGHNYLHLAFLIALGSIALIIFLYSPFYPFRPSYELRALVPKSMQHFGNFTLYLSFFIYWIFVSVGAALIYPVFGFMALEMMYMGYGWEKVKHLGFWRASWFLGLFWGIWATPLYITGFRYPGQFLGSFFWIIIYSVLISPVKVFLRLKSKTIICPAFLMVLMNHFSNIFFYIFEPQDNFLYGIYGTSSFVAMAIVNLILFLKTRKTPFLEYEI